MGVLKISALDNCKYVNELLYIQHAEAGQWCCSSPRAHLKVQRVVHVLPLQCHKKCWLWIYRLTVVPCFTIRSVTRWTQDQTIMLTQLLHSAKLCETSISATQFLENYRSECDCSILEADCFFAKLHEWMGSPLALESASNQSVI